MILESSIIAGAALAIAIMTFISAQWQLVRTARADRVESMEVRLRRAESSLMECEKAKLLLLERLNVVATELAALRR